MNTPSQTTARFPTDLSAACETCVKVSSACSNVFPSALSSACVWLSFAQQFRLSSSPPVLKSFDGNIDAADLRSDAVKLEVVGDAIRSWPAGGSGGGLVR